MALSVDFIESLNDSYPIDFSQFSSLCTSTPKTKSFHKNSAKRLPIDLRIGSKTRIISSKPFSWMKNTSVIGTHAVLIPPKEITAAMRFSMNGHAENEEEIEQHVSLTSLALLQAAVMLYQSAVPLAKPVFPRLGGTFSNKKFTKNTAVNALIAEWTDSFDHLCATWLVGERNYFYACAYSFTVLFTRALKNLSNGDDDSNDKENCRTPQRNDNSNSTDSQLFTNLSSSPPLLSFQSVYNDGSACGGNYSGDNSDGDADETVKSKLNQEYTHKIVISPTTLGFRELLTAENIHFTLPLRSTNKSFMDYAREKGDVDFISANKDEEELDEDEWLKDIGISPKSTIKFRKSYSSIDFSSTAFENLNAEDEERQPQSAGVIGCEINVNEVQFGAGRKRKAPNSFNTATSSQQQQPNQSGNEDASRSTVVIAEPASINAFCQMLRSLKVGVSKNGLHAGLAPTLLAPSPFLGAVSKKLNLTSHITKKSGEFKYVLEVDDGPILPFVTKMLSDFLIHSFAEANSNTLVEKTSKSKSAKIQVLGRLPYAGFNEAVHTKLAANINEFELDLSSHMFSW